MKKPIKIIPLFILAAKTLLGILIFTVLFLLLFSSSMNTSLSHDEHQFISSGKLLQNHMHLPYINYPYFHMPYLVFIYALLFEIFSSPLIAARCFSVVCSLLILLLIFHTSLKLFRSSKYPIRLMIALGLLFILINSPLFLYANNLAWNHTPATLFALYGLILCLSCYDYKTAETSMFFAGMMIGISAGIRLSFALMPIPFLIIIFYNPLFRLLKDKLKLSFIFCFGLLLAMLPAIAFFLFSKENFIFGNLGYASLNTLYRQSMGHEKAMTLFGKFIYFKEIMSAPCNFYILLIFVFFALAAFLKKNSKFHYKFEISSVLFVLPFLLAGSFAPTPSWYQYFYSWIPFLILGILYSIKTLFDTNKDKIFVLILFSLILVLVNSKAKFNVSSFMPKLEKTKISNTWKTTKINSQSKEIKQLVKRGKVLTLAPIYPLESNIEIYKEFATGPFAYRIGHLLSREERKKNNIISGEDLSSFLDQEKPKGILVGFESCLESSLIDYAESNNYKKIILFEDKILYVPSLD